VGRPAAAEPEELADLGAEQGPDRGDEFRAASFGCDPGDRVAGFGVGEGDALEDAVQYRAAARAGHHRWHEDNLSPGTARAGDRRPEPHVE
jgi:hypothetical protein